MLFEDCICFQLGRTTRRVTQQYRRYLADLGLTHTQFFVLVALMEEEGIVPSQLARKLVLDRPTTSGLVDRLEADQWIERRPDPDDGRAQRLYLTTKGRRRRKAVRTLYRRTNAKLLARFTAKEWSQLQNLLRRLDVDLQA